MNSLVSVAWSITPTDGVVAPRWRVGDRDGFRIEEPPGDEDGWHL